MAMEHAFLQLLELPTTPSASRIFLSPKLKAVLNSGRIHGAVKPDLPPRSLLSAFLSSDGAPAGVRSSNVKSHTSTRLVPFGQDPSKVNAVEKVTHEAGCRQVQTVAAQLRSLQHVRSNMIISAERIEASGCGGSLLLVSGGHPLRSFHLVKKFFPMDSLEMLCLASELRRTGEIPPGWIEGVELWAVENPLTNTVDRLEQKIEAGAELVIVQPPLIQETFEKWWDSAHHRGLLHQVRVVVGLPLITSAHNLEFWLGLTRSFGEHADRRLARFRELEALVSSNDPSKSSTFRDETIRLSQFIKNLPGVAGVHVMPITPSGWRQFAELQDQILSHV